MKFIFNILVLFALIHGQPINLNFPGYLNTFHIPADTNWREYKIPYALLEPDTSLVLWLPSVVFSINDQEVSYPDSSRWWVDNIHFPSNSWQTFEDSANVMLDYDSSDVWYSTSTNTPDGSDSSLVFGYRLVNNQTPNFALIVEDPLINYPAVPDTVGVWIKAEQSSDLTQFIPLDYGNLWQWDNLQLKQRRISVITSAVATDCTVTWQADEYFYNADSVTISQRLFTTSVREPDRILEEDQRYNYSTLWDFDLLPGQYLENEPLYPTEECYTSVFGTNIFTKRYEAQTSAMYPFFKFAYGVGLIEFGDWAFTNTLSGARIQNQDLGHFAFINNLSVNLDQSYLSVQVYPDSNWYGYIIPVKELILPGDFNPEGNIEIQNLNLFPHFFKLQVDDGEFYIDDIVLRNAASANEYLIDDFESGLVNWSVITGANGNAVQIQIISDSMDNTNSVLQLDFENINSEPFDGYISKQLDTSTIPQFNRDDYLIFRLREGSGTLDVIPPTTEIPEQYYLHQNFPNPFNASTTIGFNLPVQTNVELTIYDLKGREVIKLINGILPAGFREIQWKAEDIASGIYIYRLTTGDQIKNSKTSITKKLVLIK